MSCTAPVSYVLWMPRASTIPPVVSAAVAALPRPHSTAKKSRLDCYVQCCFHSEYLSLLELLISVCRLASSMANLLIEVACVNLPLDIRRICWPG